MNSSQLSMRRSLDEFLTPTPMTNLSFSFNFDTRGEKSESPEATTKTSMWSLDQAMSMASTTMRMSAEFFPEYEREGISINSMAASCSSRLYSWYLSQSE